MLGVNLDFTEDDLIKPLEVFFKTASENVTLAQFDLTEKEFQDMEKMFDHYILYNYEIPLFVSKPVLAKCLLYIGATLSSKRTLGDWIAEFYQPVMPLNGNLMNFICSCSMDDLFERGW